MRLQPLNRFGRWGVFQQPARHPPRLVATVQVLDFRCGLEVCTLPPMNVQKRPFTDMY